MWAVSYGCGCSFAGVVDGLRIAVEHYAANLGLKTHYGALACHQQQPLDQVAHRKAIYRQVMHMNADDTPTQPLYTHHMAMGRLTKWPKCYSYL